MRRGLRRLVVAATVVAVGLAPAGLLGTPGAAGATEPATGGVDASLRVSPLAVALTLVPDQAGVGRRVRARVAVTNLGPTAISGVTAEIRLDRDGLVIAGSAVVVIGRIRPGQTASVSWSVCGRLAGQYLVLARATLDGASVESPARLLTITPGGRRSCP